MIRSTYNQAINHALHDILNNNPHALVWGPGTNDPKRVFGTTNTLLENFGSKRVFDGAISEAAYTGHALGLALSGKSPIIHYQRVDFAFMAWDQIVNNISKWSAMFGPEQKHLPITLRVIQGRGWGQGQQHSQNPLRMLASFPGIQVLTPVTPKQAYQALLKAQRDQSPTIIYEHRWLQGYEQEWEKEEDFEEVSVYGEKSSDLTLMSYSYGVIECLRAKKILNQNGISVKVISINQFDQHSHRRIQEAFANSQKSIIFDLAWYSNAPLKDFLQLRESDYLSYITLQDEYTPTSVQLIKDYYPTDRDILLKAKDMLKLNQLKVDHSRGNLDQPLYDNLLNEEIPQ